LSHSTRLFFELGIFEREYVELFSQARLETSVLLISASWVARITCVNHRHRA
jgi:hypothetical protein